MVTQTQFDSFKEDAIRKQPIRKRILLSDLKFHTMDCVEYAGVMLGLNRQGLKDIIKIIGFSVSGGSELKKSVGEESAINILNALKNVTGTIKREVTIAVTPDRVITKVSPNSSSSLISVETYFDTFEKLANNHNLEIQSTSFNSESGTVSISALASNHEFQVGNISDEVFRTGLSFSRNMEGIQADPYMHRLVCTNGMVTRQFEESFKLRNMEPKMWEEFYTHLDRIEKSGFVPKTFSQAVERSMNSRASLAELERGVTLLTGSSNIPEGELEIFFRGLKHTYSKFHSAGIDTTKLTVDQKRNSRTALTHWDVINGITDFASHNYGYEKKANSDRHLQLQAGDLLASVPHTSNLILNQPF
jgi:hypothetical protein